VASLAVIFGKVFSLVRYTGMALILAGPSIIVLPADWVERLNARASQR